ncbi:homoserine kinase [Trypanosoma rangeli]|uniref:Homoserine kinase n=1 Tax=Trypanosoma rangeli TaxID=5698 RepID=A0A3R7KWX7_TRYRA|nr:homoserine kinase [Trypanosoma rangeli]RNF11318.1 homoserine kinase [Trypanosoma rangeli]|eukprot:RNF11318.1 homoserine kinase [Trypanosoma rangeli]
MSKLPKKVVLRVPATTANLGPAYDVLGMALSIFMEVTVEYADAFSLHLEGDGSEHIRTDRENLLVKACERAFEYAQKEMPPLKFLVKSNIPFGCGCGSSSAAAVAGFVAGMKLCGLSLEEEKEEAILQVIAEFEGHPDNAAPALYGGIQLGYKDNTGRFLTHRVPTATFFSVVLFVPKDKMKVNTHATRDLIPSTVSLEDAVFNVSRASVLVLAFCTGNLDLLKCCDDKLHQQQRADALFPHFRPCVNAAMAAGAQYAFLSGAGPTVCAFVSGQYGDPLIDPRSKHNAETVADAMLQAANAVGIPGRVILTRPSEQGVHLVGVTSIRPEFEYISI